MRALLTPEIAPRMGIVLFRPGSELMPLFMQGRVLLEPEPERYSSFASGAVPAASQPLADDPAVRAVFRNEAVIRRAGGVECLESWLRREKGCQWPHSDWHSENMTTMRHAPGAIRLSGLQRIEYLAFVQQRTAKFDAEEGELPEAERQIAFLRMGMDINAWLVSRSLWNAEQSQDVETLCASVITTWSYDALGAGAEMVLSLSGMGAIENAGDLEHEVLTPEKS